MQGSLTPRSGERSKDLVLYTISYPYGDSEWFLHAELKVLARYFDRIFLWPSYPSSLPEVREVPSNVHVLAPIAQAGGGWLAKCRRHGRALRVLAAATMRSGDRWAHLRGLRHMYRVANSELARIGSLREFIADNGLERAIHYNYWLLNNSLPLARMRNQGEIAALICRAHGFDLYDERHPTCLPFRHFRMEGVDAVVAISRHGAAYLREKAAPHQARKIKLMPLGIALGDTCLGPLPDQGGDAVPLLVSCSRIHPIKQVGRIIEALSCLKQPVRWVHIGDGPGRTKLEAAAEKLPPHILWDFVGSLSNADVFDFYRTHPVAAFLNLSSMEGLPVSMMEAAAFGIPLIGTEVGGVPEIISYSTGVLVSPDAEPEAIARQIESALQRKWNREAIREEMLARFDAGASFSAFAEFLLSFVQEEEVGEGVPGEAVPQMRLTH